MCRPVTATRILFSFKKIAKPVSNRSRTLVLYSGCLRIWSCRRRLISLADRVRPHDGTAGDTGESPYQAEGPRDVGARGEFVEIYGARVVRMRTLAG